MPLAVGQIGVGYWGPNLLRNLLTNARVDLAAVADADEGRRKYVSDQASDVSVCSTAEELIQDDSLAALVIATPAATHFQLALSALQAGKHILVEKPMALTVTEVEELGQEAADRGLVAMVGHTFLFNPTVEYLRELVMSGELGRIRYIYSNRVNLGRIRSDVDALWNLAPHDVSIIQFLLGDPEPVRVTRQGMDYIQPGVDDVVFLHLEYPDQVMAHVQVSWLDPHKVRRMVVVGSDKMAVYDELAKDKLAIFDKGIDPIAELGQQMDYDRDGGAAFRYRSGDVTMPTIPEAEPLAVEIDHWLDCILDGAECRTGPHHAARVVQVLQMATDLRRGPDGNA
jgi:predicted dehydrogenase